MTLHVIVPVYNASRYISEALHSILDRRDHAPFAANIVLVNDGSSDNSGEICKEFAERYTGIAYIEQKNKGVSAARNAAMQHVFQNCASDDWIGFLDADDAWHCDWPLALEQCRRSTVDVIGFGMSFADEHLKMRGGYEPEERTLIGGTDTAIAENRRMHFGSYLYRAGHLMDHEIFFIPGVTNGEDLMFKYCAFFAAKQIEYCSYRLYVYRHNQYSVTSNLEKQALQYYGVFFKAWNGLMTWLTKQVSVSESAQMIEFARKRNNCTCMYAARSYCAWHNGSFSDFEREIINGLLLQRFLKPVEFEDDASLSRDYKCLINHPKRFYMKFYLQGIRDEMKEYIKRLIKLSASK